MSALSKPEWHDSFPVPQSTPGGIEKTLLLHWMQSGKVTGKDFLLVDLRRADHEGGMIRGSINLPAQTLWYSLPAVYQLIKTADVEIVVWYCGSSKGRGSRAAAWLTDHAESQGDKSIKSVTLQGGIKEWVTGGDEYTSLMEGFDPSAWNS